MRPSGILLCILACSSQLPAAPPAIEFQRDVRPILSDACFHCHGPDKETRMAGLRLDRRDEATAQRKDGAAIVPKDPDKSLLWQRVTHASPAKRMPPAYSHKVLTDEQKEILKRWIEQGAPWREHWAFAAPVRPAPPAVKNTAWPRSPLDRFILARLEAAGLQPAQEADRRTLARRAALDITGLPPKPEDVDAFVNDPAPDAYERLVDKYLASPHYGEHRARYWLDAARYADTHGIHIDNYREMWAYRDWVINAYNRNLPFDRFTIEQLAGDMLPNRTIEQQIASGFQRCNATTNEAGVIIEEIEAMYAKDRVDTTAAVWLGLTLGCATCHDHKFDPLTQRDFYSLAAFYRNTTQHVMDGNIPDSAPVIAVPAGADRTRWEQLEKSRTTLLASLRKMEAARDPAFSAWVRSAPRRRIARPLDLKSQVFDLMGKPLDLPEGVTRGESGIPGIPALHFKEKASLELPNLKAIDADQPFTIAVWFYYPKAEERYVLASQSDPEDKNRGLVMWVSGRNPQFRLTADEGKSITASAGHLDQIRMGAWNHVVYTYDGSRVQSGMGIHINGRAVNTQGRDVKNTLAGSVNTGKPLLIGRENKSFFPDGAIAEFRVYDRVVTEQEVRALASWPLAYAARRKPTPKLSVEERSALQAYYLNRWNQPYRTLAAKLHGVNMERSEIARRSPVTHVQEERTDQKPFAHILYRGMYDQPRDRVAPDVPAVLPRMKPGMPRNRLGLAQWLVAPENPLTARVIVNRFWQEVFGTGLVKTAEDFGSQGEVPSHPELLDWLAVEFRESGWDMKKFIRMLVTSATYRQSAQVTPEKLRADPENRLLSRGPRFRMDAEMVRDYALAASGLLNPQIGGPSVKPYQPDGIWEAVAMLGSNTRFYKRDAGDKLYRRSLYWFWKRSAPPASMDIFNAPTRELCTVRRERTNTPLQALVTMNDTQFVEAARMLAQRAMIRGGSDAGKRFEFLARSLLARDLDQREVEIVRRAWRDYLNYYDSNPGDAKKLLAVGESKADESLNKAEFAALTMVANQMMNLDEVLNK
jgi:hypothetical protein